MGEDLYNIDCRDDSRHKTYVQKWSHSGEYDDNDDDDDGSEDSGDMQDYSTLPVFADDECRNIYRATLELESKCDRKSRRTKQFKDRLKTMQDHMHHIRQEIDLTNSLIAADKDDIRAEEHLLALGQRERANILAEMKEIDQSLMFEERQMKSLEARKAKATEETESLKLALNCNQEELEQWAKAAATKETDYLTLEKYTRADDVKIKELTMKLEAKTTLSLAKKIELENEVMETQNQRLEFERTLKMFHNEQKERQSMMSQLQEALEFIERKDHEIHQLSRKYSNLDFDLNKKLQKVIKMRRSIEEQRVRLLILVLISLK
jgi:chromosome segregation ATPase